MLKTIQSGRTYLVHYFGQLYRAEALWPAAVPHGWWQCRLSDRIETLMPEEAFIQECGDSTESQVILSP